METLLNKMYKFQKENNIKDECITNVQYLYNLIKPFGKVKAVLAYFKIEKKRVLVIHLIVQNDFSFLDPSYDIKRYRPIYYDSISDVKPIINNHNTGLNKRDFITKWLDFIQYADMMNNGISIISNIDYYNNLIQYMLNEK